LLIQRDSVNTYAIRQNDEDYAVNRSTEAEKSVTIISRRTLLNSISMPALLSSSFQ
jgi:hypothetical protein